MGKGQKPANPVLSSLIPPRGEDNIASWLREGRRMYSDKTKERTCRKPHRTSSLGSEHFQRPRTFPQLPCTPAQLSEPHRGCQACPYPDISH